MARTPKSGTKPATGQTTGDSFATTSGIGRAMRLARLTTGITGSYLGYMLQRKLLGEERTAASRAATYEKVGRRVREELVEMRGPVMKLGQALSLHTDSLPDELLAQLSQLQMEAPGMHPSLTRAQFKISMGRLPEEVFSTFASEPFAAASLGQVHRAVLRDGTEVAVKIQYPGMRAAIENDFRLLRNVALPARASGHFTKSAIDEIEAQIAVETDYLREAENIEYFRGALKSLDYVEVPRVFRDYSTDRVLTMSLVSGSHLEAFLAGRPSQHIRDLLGERLFELFYFQILFLHTLHADPHWGNYLFRNDGTIGLIDFGCVKKMGAAVVRGLRKSFLYSGKLDSPEFQRMVQEQFGQRGRSVSPRTRRAVIAFSEQFYRKVYPPDEARAKHAVDFADANILSNYLTAARQLGNAKGTQPDYIFMARAEIGLYTTLHRLRSRVHTTEILRRLLKQSESV